MENSKRWQRAELLIFTAFTILNLLPFVATRFFPSMDGASHLSNSNIINQLMFHHNNLFSQFFMINREPVPNWTSHLVISLLTLVMPAFLAEKLLILVILGGIPFAFRNLMQTISPKNHLYSFLIFPFTHSMFFFFGFFNFCMAILFLLITLNYWLRNENDYWNRRKVIIFILLVLATYFSHIVIFGLEMILVVLQVITNSAASLLCRKEDFRTIVTSLLKRVLVITLAGIVPLLLFVYFFYSRPGTREITFIARKVLVDYLATVRPLISLNPIIEAKYTVILNYLLIIPVAAGIAAFFYRVFRKFFPGPATAGNTVERLLPGTRFWWLLISILCLLFLYFRLPDAYGTASYTNLRIAFVIFLVLFLLVSTFRIPWWIGLMAIAASIYVNTALIRYYTPSILDLSKLAVSCNKASDFVAPNSLVLPIYCMDNWFTGHFVDYLAVDKPIVMVYNYECESGYFPVKWNEKSRPNYYFGNPVKPDNYINFEITKGRPSLRLDYVFVVGQFDPQKDWFFAKLNRILTDDFTRVYATETCSLYKNRAVTPKTLPAK